MDEHRIGGSVIEVDAESFFVIVAIAVDGGHMRSSTAAGLVGAAMLSTLIFPFVGLALRRGSRAPAV